MPYPGYTTEEVAGRGRAIYEDRLRSELEATSSGKFIVIDIESGDFEVADEDLDASEMLLLRRPNAILYGTRVGERAAYRLGGHSPVRG